MIKHYIIGTFRSIWKRKFFYFANILVMSIVFATSSHLYRYIGFQHSFDQFHTDSKNIYRVTTKLTDKENGSILHYAICSGKYGKMLTDEYPEVTNYVNITPMPDDCSVLIGNRCFRENKAYYVDSSFFSIFSFQLLSGNIKETLNKPYTVVLSEYTAQKYFGNNNPIGKTITLRGKYHKDSYRVTGVFKDPPSNSHIQARILVSNLELYDKEGSFENSMRHWTYIKLRNKSDINNVAVKINKKLERLSKYSDEIWQFDFQKLEDIHLFSRLRQEMREVTNGGYKSIYTILMIGIICLLIAFLNFINSSLTRASEKSGEIGIRNTFGAGSRDHIKLFFIESSILILLSLIIAIILYLITIKPTNLYFGYSDSNIFGYSEEGIKAFDIRFLLMLGTLLFLISMIFSFIYAIIYSRVNTLIILQKRTKNIFSKKITFRSLPILIQFTVCFILLSFSIIVYQQNDYIKNKDLGYDPQNTVMILMPHLDETHNLKNLMTRYDEIIMESPLIKNVTRAVYNPGYKGYGQWVGVSIKGESNKNFITTPQNTVMYNYFELYDIQFIVGSSFKKEGKGDEAVVSMSLLPLLGYDKPQDILGQYLIIGRTHTMCKVIGVVEDVHQETLDKKIMSLVYIQEINNYAHAVTVKVAQDKFENAINFLENEWYKIFPESDFVYEIVEDKINNLYKEQKRFQYWLTSFSFLALIICIVGISVLTYFAFKERQKEIAIRKVLGANLFNLSFIAGGFFKVLGISLVLGLSISSIISKNWLSTFVYRIDLNIWSYLIPIIIVLSVFLINLAISLGKAYIYNPTYALKEE